MVKIRLTQSDRRGPGGAAFTVTPCWSSSPTMSSWAKVGRIVSNSSTGSVAAGHPDRLA